MMSSRIRRKRTLVKVSAVAIAGLFALTACSGGTSTPTAPSTNGGATTGTDVSPELAAMQEAGLIKVGIANQPPFSGIQADGSLEGITPAVISDIFAELGVPKVEAAAAPYGQLIPGLQSGRWDLVGAAMTVTAERCEQVTFTNPILWDGSAIVYDEAKIANPISSLVDVVDQNLKVGMVQSSFRVTIAEEIGIPESNRVQFPDDPAIYDALRTGRIDVAFLANSSVKYHLGDDVEYEVVYPVAEEPPHATALAFRLEDTALAAEFDEVFSKYVSDGRLAERHAEFGFVTPEGLENETTAAICAQLIEEEAE